MPTTAVWSLALAGNGSLYAALQAAPIRRQP